MRFNTFLSRWRGIFLVLITCISSLWLAATDQLSLYIHPRYTIFTIIMTCFGLLLGYVGLCRHARKTPSNHSRKHWTSLFYYPLIGALWICAIVILLVATPSTLTSAVLQNRTINSGVATDASLTNTVPLFGSSDYTHLTIKDWAPLLSQTTDISFFNNKKARVTGFVSPDASDPENIFYVSRFVITCCAVDAQPIGVPIYLPEWQSKYPADSWVRAEGLFGATTDAHNKQRITLRPTKIDAIQQPKDPYVY